MRIVVELKRDAIPQVVLNKLYKLTPMQSSFGIINLAIVDGQPRVLERSSRCSKHFVEFRREVVRRRTEFELRKAQARAHILEGLNKAIDALDYIIPLIRNARLGRRGAAVADGQHRDDDRGQAVEGRRRRMSTVAGFVDKLQEGHAAARILRDAGTGDPRSATAPSLGARTSEDPRRVRRDHQAHRRAGKDSRQRERPCGRSSSTNWRRSRRTSATRAARRSSMRASSSPSRT